MKLKTNQYFTKKTKKKIEIKRIKTEVEILINKSMPLKF
jgi:hypothetical protein